MWTLAIDVGAPHNVGWACSDGSTGDGSVLTGALQRGSEELKSGRAISIGFEAPIWVPRRTEFGRITSRRGGVEAEFNRPWSAGAGCGALAAGLGIMSWTFAKLSSFGPPRLATTRYIDFMKKPSGLLVWEAFVSGRAKAVTHIGDAQSALAAFQVRQGAEPSDVQEEPGLNLAAAALLAAGWTVDVEELGASAFVVACR